MQWSITRRPRTLNELYGLNNIKTYFYEKAKTKDWPKAVLLRGQFGNGKTCAAQIIASMMVCQHPLPNGDPCGVCPECDAIINERFDAAVQMIDGGQAGKADVVEQVSEFANGAFFSKRRVMILEEIGELSTAAKNSLLKILETPKENVYFILLSMETGGASGLASRCVPFNFKKIPVKELMLFLKQTMEAEGLWVDASIPDEFRMKGLATIAQVAQGSIRQALQLLETCIIGKYFTSQEIVDNLGIADESMVIHTLLGLCDGADSEVWGELQKYEPFEFFALGYKIVSDAAVYRASGYLANEGNTFFENNTKALAAKAAFPALLGAFDNLSPNSKPFLRKSELVSAMVPVYTYNRDQQAMHARGGTGLIEGRSTVNLNNHIDTLTADTPVPTRTIPVRTRG
jgi:DNA polymerase III delta prime subunit